MRARGWQSGVETPFDFARHGGQAQDEPHSKKATRCWRHGGQAAEHALTKQKPQPSKSMKGGAAALMGGIREANGVTIDDLARVKRAKGIYV